MQQKKVCEKHKPRLRRDSNKRLEDVLLLIMWGKEDPLPGTVSKALERQSNVLCGSRRACEITKVQNVFYLEIFEGEENLSMSR